MTCAKRYKIEKKVREHNRKIKKLNKLNEKKHKAPKPVSVPNKCPFKEEMLMEAEKARDKIKEEKLQKKLALKKKRAERLSEKRKLENVGSHEKFMAEAQKKDEEFERLATAGTSEEYKSEENNDRTVKAFVSEVRKTIEAADIIVEVLDARDPLGSRCRKVEQSVLDSGKRLILLLNKIDLVSKENVQKWLKYLRGQMPTIAFKASTQEQALRIGRFSTSNLHDISSKCIGADLLMKLFGNYCRNKDIKTSIRVGVVGFPNVGKSSVINSMKRKRSCNVGAQPGITKQLQEVELDKHIRLIDSPGVVLATAGEMDPVEMALKNALRVEALTDSVAPVMAIIRRWSKDALMLHYNIPDFNTCEEFLALLARKIGRLKKGGRPDINAAAKKVLNDWNVGKLRYYTEPPETEGTVSNADAALCSAEVLAEYSKEFNLEDLDADEKIVIEGLPEVFSSETGVLYNPNESLSEQNCAEEMETDDNADGRVVFVPQAKENKKGETEKVKSLFPKTLNIDGNSQLNKAIRMAVKRQKKKGKKLAKRTEKLIEQMDTATLQEDYDFSVLK